MKFFSLDEWAKAFVFSLSFSFASLIVFAIPFWGKEPPSLWDSYLIALVTFFGWTTTFRVAFWLYERS